MKYGQVGGYGSVPEKKRYGCVITIILFIVLLLAVGGFLYYKFVYSANTIKLFLNKTFDYLETAVETSDYDSVVNDFLVQMKLQSSDDETNQMLKVFNKIEFSGSYGIDYDKNIISLDFKSDYDDKDLIDVSVYTEYGRAYVYLDGLYDKYIDSSIDNYSDLFERKTDDAKNVIVSIRKAMEKSLKDEYFSVEKVTIDGEKISKTTLNLTGKDYQVFNENMVDFLINDKNFLDSYASVFDEEVDDVKDMLNDMIEDSKDYKGEKYFLYTKDFNFMKFEAIFEDDSFVVENKNGIYEYEWYENDTKVMFGVVEVFDTKENAGKVKFSLYDNEDFGMELTIEVSTNKNGEVARQDITNSISSEKITEEDVNAINDKLMKNDGVVAIINELSKIFSSEEDKSLPVVTT